MDGGLIANNPCLDALTAFTKYNRALEAVGRTSEMRSLQLLLSIGTGKPPVLPAEVPDISGYIPTMARLDLVYNLSNQIMNMALQTDAHVVERAQAWCRSTKVAYFRLSPPLGESLLLNVVDDSEIVNALWETKAYMCAQSANLDLLVKILELSVN